MMIRKHLFNLAKTNLTLKTQQNLLKTAQNHKFSTSKQDEKEAQEAQSQAQQIEQMRKRQKLKQEINNDSNQEYKEQEQTYQQENRNTIGWWIWRGLFWGSVGIFSYNCYLAANETKQNPADNETGALPFFLSSARYSYGKYCEIMEFFTEPPVKKLLCDPIHPDIQPKTLALNLSGTLIETDFVLGKGAILKRRPGLNQFLMKLSQLYEIILFSDDEYMFMAQTIPKLDSRQQFFMGFFGRQCMVWHKGHYVKDLKYLNRDLRHIIVIDKTKDNVVKQPYNAIIIPEFHGEKEDNELLKLLPLLENLASPEVKDVRKILQKLGDNPHDKFYQKLKSSKQKLEAKQKSGLFGYISGHPKN